MEPREQQVQWSIVELQRRLSNIVRKGTVHELDAGAARARVQYDEEPDGTPCVTTWLQWGVRRAGPDRTWWAPEVGEQVVLLSPSGDLKQAVIICSLWQEAFPPNGDRADLSRTDLADGTYWQHDRETGKTTVNISGDAQVDVGGDARLNAAGAVVVTAASIDLN